MWFSFDKFKNILENVLYQAVNESAMIVGGAGSNNSPAGMERGLICMKEYSIETVG